MSDTLSATGAAGAVPPPDAPHEVSQPLTAHAGAIAPAVNPRTLEPYAREEWHTMSPIERARHNERTLEPLHYGSPAAQPPAGTVGPTTGGVGEATRAAAEGQLDPFYANLRAQGKEPAATPAPAAPAALPGQPIRRILRRTSRPPVEVSDASVRAPADPGDAGVHPAPVAASALIAPTPADPLAPIDLSIHPEAETQPAWSNTDSPSRGQPRLPVDPGKAITGGFGDAAALQYFALDGTELRTLVEQLMDEVHARIQNDLRFNEALCYPQVSARVVVEISGFANDTAFTIDRVLPSAHPARATNPVEFARTVADEIVFVLVAERRETDDAGNSVTPPDQTRRELGLVGPRKQAVRLAGGNATWVDKR